MNIDLWELQKAPRIHFYICGFSPILPKNRNNIIQNDDEKEDNMDVNDVKDVQKVVKECFKSKNWLVDIKNFDPLEDLYNFFLFLTSCKKIYFEKFNLDF